MKSYIPQFYYLLDDNDKQQYTTIRKSQKEGQKKTEMTFVKDIKNLKKFIIRGKEDDWKRGIVCGIYWLPQNKGIAVNIQQLKIILNKSKSSLNTSLSKIGLDVVLTRGKAISLVLDTFPILNNHPSEVKRWTIRKLADLSPPTSPVQNDIPQSIEYEKSTDNSILSTQNEYIDLLENSKNDELYQCNEIFCLCYC